MPEDEAFLDEIERRMALMRAQKDQHNAHLRMELGKMLQSLGEIENQLVSAEQEYQIDKESRFAVEAKRRVNTMPLPVGAEPIQIHKAPAPRISQHPVYSSDPPAYLNEPEQSKTPEW